MTVYPADAPHDRPEPRTQPYLEWDPPPPYEPCPPCAAHYRAEVARWQRVVFALADAEAYHRDDRERLTRDLAIANQANEGLRRTIDRVRHYDTEGGT